VKRDFVKHDFPERAFQDRGFQERGPQERGFQAKGGQHRQSRPLAPGRRGEPLSPPSWRRTAAARAAAPPPGSPAGFTRFRINWGFRDGADPRRILAHVCRRGGIDSKMVGAIELQTTASTFNVGNAVAAAFARRVQARDRRDPHLFIVPADSRGPRPKAAKQNA